MSRLKINRVYSGRSFNKLCNHRLYLTNTNNITNTADNNYNYLYENGLNVDPTIFNPSRSGNTGGFYFFDETQIYAYAYEDDYWIRKVEIPDNARVYVHHNMYKTDRFILDEMIEIRNVKSTDLNDVYDECIDFLKRDYGNTKNFRFTCMSDYKRDIKIACTNMLKRNGCMLKYMDIQSELLCLEAVKQNGMALKYVKKQTKHICAVAVKQNGLSLQYVKSQTIKLCLDATQQNQMALLYVNV